MQVQVQVAGSVGGLGGWAVAGSVGGLGGWAGWLGWAAGLAGCLGWQEGKEAQNTVNCGEKWPHEKLTKTP